jgi:uncharacterized protein (DUF1501 family)
MNRELRTMSRREAMRRSLALSALASAQLAWPTWMPRLSFASKRRAPQGDVLVCIFLRGGADGLNIIVPHGDAAYHRARPRLGVAHPDARSRPADERALNLDGFFGLHPTMAPLLPIFQGGGLVAIHATGSPDPTRSHFDAMSYMERGTPGSYALTTGWLGRHLASMEPENASVLRAIGWGNTLQQSLRGSISATAIKSIVDYHLGGRQEAAAQMLATLNTLYGADPTALRAAADQTQAVLDLVSRINVAGYQPTGGAAYDDDDEFDLALMQTAALIKADVGLEIAAVDLGGWDTHQNQANDLPGLLTTLSRGLAAFHADMAQQMQKITVVVMSEFGRRVEENASGGTDHGHGNAMLVMGGNVIAKPVFADWPGLEPEHLRDGDLAITIDYRDVLSEVLAKRLNNPQPELVFPDFSPTMRGILR